MRPISNTLLVSAAILGIALMGGGCTKKPATTSTSQAAGQQATVTLNDGSGFAGTVTNSSTGSITLRAPNGETRTYPMTEVASVQYGTSPTESAPAPLAGSPPADSTAPAAASGNLPPSNLPPSGPPPVTTPAPAAAVSNAPPAAVAPVRPATPPAPVAIVRTVPAGARLVVRNNEAIDSKTATPGQTYSGVVEQSVVDTNGRVVIPRGSPATLVVRSATDQGKIQGQSQLALDIDAVSIAGRRYRVETTDLIKKGTAGFGENKRTGTFLGGGTALGALLGAVAGGGRGAAIGALSGAAAGTATQAVTRGKGVKVPAETLMTFRLEAPVRVREVR